MTREQAMAAVAQVVEAAKRFEQAERELKEAEGRLLRVLHEAFPLPGR